jgi:hypothetical protein
MLVSEPDGNRSLRAHSFKVEENIKMKFKDTDLKIVNFVRLVHAEASGGLL